MKKTDKATKRRGRELTFKTMPAGVFKTNFSAVIDVVQAKSESIIITKRGKPIVKLVPVSSDHDYFFNFMRGKRRHRRRRCEPVLADE